VDELGAAAASLLAVGAIAAVELHLGSVAVPAAVTSKHMPSARIVPSVPPVHCCAPNPTPQIPAGASLFAASEHIWSTQP
jgi:hypothetical protein